ncbi:hypothetical protein OAS39_10240, partial [Pirellulales bacterium]|nr:hypothetical protein [Pirellulales bacterium]
MSATCFGSTRHPNRRGLITWVTLLAVLLLCLLMAIVFNVGATVNSKLHVQNASDAIAFSDAVWMARGMNSVTAANHLIGEASALYILHHAIGGNRLDTQEVTPMPAEPIPLDPEIIEAGYLAAAAVAQVPPERPGVVKDEVKAGKKSMIFKSKKALKQQLLAAYGAHAAAAVTLNSGAQEAAKLLQMAIIAEYEFLNAVESVAVMLIPVKTEALPALLTALNEYTEYVVTTATPEAVQQATEAIAEEHFVIASAEAQLPVVREDPPECLRALAAGEARQNEWARDDRSQLMRATYPWVQSWSKPLLEVLGTSAPLSGAEGWYRYYANYWSRRIVRQFRRPSASTLASGTQRCFRRSPQRSLGLTLYVLEGLDPAEADKTEEPWSQADAKSLEALDLEGVFMADRMFSLLATARQETPNRVSAPAFYRQANPDGVLTFAQAMIYNANPQLGSDPTEPTVPEPDDDPTEDEDEVADEWEDEQQEGDAE